MKFLHILALSYSLAVAYAEEYLIRFKTPDSFQMFMDTSFSRAYSVKGFLDSKIGKTFAFGSFRGITIDVSKDVMERIRSNSLIAEMAPNTQFNAFDDELLNDRKIKYMHTDESEDDRDEQHRGEDENEDSYYPDEVKIQREAPRHLSRLSRRSQLPYDFDIEDEYSDRYNYYYNKLERGGDVNAYIIDTGIYKEHVDFQGRAVFGEDLTGEGPGDGNGHGTHVAGIVGSKTFGVAKKVNLIEVKALNSKGQGNLTTVISAIEFAVNHCKNSGRKGCVANLSLGSMRNSVINQAVKAAHEAGLVVVAAAGNSNINACWNSPASAPEAITVGAFDDRTDTIAKFSNWGACVDIFASGVKVQSLSHIPPFKPVAFSGTSMASPSITGLVVILLEKGVTPTEIKEKINHLATEDLLQKRTLFFKPGTPNRIAFNGIDKDDDEFDDATYPIVDVDMLIQELQNYQPDLQQLKSIEDGGFDIINYQNGMLLPLGQLNLRKRIVLSPVI